MKSIRTKILTVGILGMLVLAIAITTVSVVYIGQILDRDSDIITETVSGTEALKINEVLGHVVTSAQMMETYMQATIESAESLSDVSRRNEYTERAKDMFFNIARNTDGVVAFYFRYNPDIAGPKDGFFVNSYAGGKELVERDTTDLTDWQNAPYETVSWYADAVTRGEPVWSTQYHNQSLSDASISYVLPFYKNYKLCGVIGIEIDATIVTDLVKEISVYNNGFAYLIGTDGEIYYSPVGDHMIDKTHTDHGYAEEHKLLDNGMELVIHADYDDIQSDRYYVILIILLCTALIVAGYVVFIIFMTNKIVHPLQLLAKSAESLADGGAEVDISCNTNDEIGVLAEAMRVTSSKLRSYMKHINALAYRDALTGVKNRTAYDEAVEVFDERIDTEDELEFAVVVADINMLKETNDTYGHDVGNQLLISASRLICSTFKHSPVFRIGGDEFVVILENEDFENRYTLIREINEVYHKTPDKVGSGEVSVTVACGLSDYVSNLDSSFEAVFNRADAQMYICKQQMKGKNQ